MTFQGYVDHVLADSPLLYWPLQETSGSAQDATANDRDGTVTSGGLWVPTNPQASRGDKAFNLPAGLTGAAYLTFTGSMDTNAGNGMSVEFWLKPDVCATGSLMLFSDTGASKFACGLSGTAGDIRFSTSGSTGRITVTAGAPAGRWAYWVFTQDAAGSSMVYKNGALVGGPSVQTVGADFPDLKVSNGTAATAVTNWQHIAVFNTVLSADRIAARWEMQASDLYDVKATDLQFPAGFDTTVMVPGGSGGSVRRLTVGQLWPRGDVTV